MSDEFFTSYDIRGKVNEGVSLEVAWNIGKGLADWLSTYGRLAVIRGQDANERLLGAVIEGLRLQGRDVVDAGSGNKDSIMKLIERDGLSGGVLVSYDPEQDVCVVELYDDNSQLISSTNGLKDIAELVEAGNFVPSAVKGELTAIV